MKRLLKWLLGGVALLLGLAVAGAIALVVLVDPNDYRDEIAAQVTQQTGREFRIDGEIAFSFFPWLGFEFGAMELGNAPGFGEQPFARIEGADARVKLLPLLRMQVEMDTIALHGLTLRLQRQADGSSNWDDLVAAGEAPAVAQKQAAPARSPEQLLGALAINGIEVRDANVLWLDAQSGQQLELKHFALTSGAIRLEQPIPLALSGEVALAQPKLDGAFTLSTRLGLALAAERYRLEGLQLKTELAGEVIPGGRLKAELQADAMADLKQQLAEIKGLKLNALGAELSGEANVSRLLEQPDAQGDLTLQINDGKALLAPFQQQLPEGLTPAALDGTRLATGFHLSLGNESAALQGLKLDGMGITLRLDAEASRILGSPAASGKLQLAVNNGEAATAAVAAMLPAQLKRQALDGATLATDFRLDLGEAQSLQLAPFTLSALGLDLEAEVAGSTLLDAPRFQGELKSGEFVPRQLVSQLGLALPEMADPSVLTKAALSSRFDGGLDHAEVEQLVVQLDQSTLRGKASLRNFTAPLIRYDLQLDAIDADRYLPPPSEEPAAAPAATSGQQPAAEAPVALPLELLRSLDIDGRLRIGKVKVMNLSSQSIDTTLKANAGRFRLHPLTAKLYDGGYSGDLRLDVHGDTPQLAMDEKLDGVQAGPLLKDFLGKDYATGKASVAAKLSAQGVEPLAIRQSLNGNGSFRFDNGQITGLNIGQLIREAYALYKGQPKPAAELKQTDFSQLQGSFNVKNGLVTTRDLSARSTLFQVAGKGSADLVKEKLDMRLDTRVVSDIRDATGQRSGELTGEVIPITIKGSFSEPAIGVDVASVLKAKAQAAIDRKKREVQQQLEQRKAEEQQKLEQKKREAEAQAQQRIEEEKKQLQKDLQDKFKNIFK